MAVREIIFRGKREDNGEWVYGFYFEEIGSFIKEKPSSVSTNTYLVTPETVGQYTGLTDKNGKKIFEGDIVKRFWLGMEIIYKITYESKHACFIGKAINTSGFTTFDNDGKKYEIIGNIYDNPELLEGGAE